MTTIETPFLKFWRCLNTALAARGLAPALYGEAHRAWDGFNGKAA